MDFLLENASLVNIVRIVFLFLEQILVKIFLVVNNVF